MAYKKYRNKESTDYEPTFSQSSNRPTTPKPPHTLFEPTHFALHLLPFDVRYAPLTHSPHKDIYMIFYASGNETVYVRAGMSKCVYVCVCVYQ